MTRFRRSSSNSSRKRKIVFATRLTEAFKHAAIRVSKSEVEQEERLIQRVVVRSKPSQVRNEDLQRFFEKILEKSGVDDIDETDA